MQQNKLISIYKNFQNKELFNWLDGRSYSDAFVICIGAGPWRISRRKQIQQLALDHLNYRDIINIHEPIAWYPLTWQNNFLSNLYDYLNQNKIFMDDFCELVIKNNDLDLLYNACGCPNGAKVLSLFARDSLKINSFPIDRHVRKFLIENNLPSNEKEMIKLCLSVGLNPRKVATGIVRNIGNVDNPDWSIK